MQADTLLDHLRQAGSLEVFRGTVGMLQRASRIMGPSEIGLHYVGDRQEAWAALDMLKKLGCVEVFSPRPAGLKGLVMYELASVEGLEYLSTRLAGLSSEQK